MLIDIFDIREAVGISYLSLTRTKSLRQMADGKTLLLPYPLGASLAPFKKPTDITPSFDRGNNLHHEASLPKISSRDNIRQKSGAHISIIHNSRPR